jgi:hypothetical protein
VRRAEEDDACGDLLGHFRGRSWLSVEECRARSTRLEVTADSRRSVGPVPVCPAWRGPAHVRRAPVRLTSKGHSMALRRAQLVRIGALAAPTLLVAAHALPGSSADPASA